MTQTLDRLGTLSKLEAGRLDGVGHVRCKVELLVSGRRSNVPILLLLRAEVLLDDVERLLVDLMILVVLQELDLVQTYDIRQTHEQTILSW